MARCLLYGAYGYTGRLIADTGKRAGLDLTLAGRDPQQLAQLAAALDLEATAFDLHDTARLQKIIAEFDLVIHAAGPFVFTYEPMVRACLAGGTHYLDISGEIPVLQALYALDGQARAAGITIMPGAAFAVVAGDCLANHMIRRLPEAIQIELAFRSSNAPRPGSRLTAIEQLKNGGLIRKDGNFKQVPIGWGVSEIQFHDSPSLVVPIPWGDLAAVARSTEAADIVTYVALPPKAVQRLLTRLGPAVQRLGNSAAFRRAARWLIRSFTHSPSEPIPGRSAMWARATAPSGETAISWLSLGQAHMFSAEAAVRCAQGIFVNNLSGALTPAQAFGPDFILEFPGAERTDLKNQEN